MSRTLPSSKRSLNVRALSRLFAEMTTSYKCLFFQALVSRLVTSDFQKPVIELDDTAVEMLRIAWYPHTFFRLSFGSQDRISRVLDSLNIPRDGGNNVDRLRGQIKECAPDVFSSKLLRYVPYRLLAPFFEQELRGVLDSKKNTQIERLANEYFHEIRPLYRLHGRDAVEFYPDWLAYLRSNLGIVQGWLNWEWLCYLQKRNPNVPAIASKLTPPPERLSMTHQRAFWKTVLKTQRLRCIYTGKPLNPKRFALDHFLPWSFVAHNQLWNLVPVPPEINSSKRDWIPSDEYLSALIEIQHQGLIAAYSELSPRAWNRIVESYISDLRINDPKGMLDQAILREGYEATVPPLMRLAERIGFPKGWKNDQEARMQ